MEWSQLLEGKLQSRNPREMSSWEELKRGIVGEHAAHLSDPSAMECSQESSPRSTLGEPGWPCALRLRALQVLTHLLPGPGASREPS